MVIARDNLFNLRNNHVLAESDDTISIENNYYFSANAIKKAFFEDSSKHTTCSWKGETSFYTFVFDGQKNENAAWFYPNPKDAAKEIKNYIAFWKGVKIEHSDLSRSIQLLLKQIGQMPLITKIS